MHTFGDRCYSNCGNEPEHGRHNCGGKRGPLGNPPLVRLGYLIDGNIEVASPIENHSDGNRKFWAATPWVVDDCHRVEKN